MANTRSSRDLARLSSLVATIAAGIPLAAMAQSDEDVIEEIVVTAQNREQAVTDVPISINVITGDAIEQAGITDIRNLGRLAPDFVTVEDADATRVSLRGIATSSNDEAQDQSLTVNIDGEYINRPRLMNASMFDVARVEVLRGPQGTLYGRNSTAGAINIITRKPTFDGFEGSASVDIGNFGSVIANGAINIPFADNFAARVAVISAQRDGYRDHPNVIINSESGDQDDFGFRVGFQYEPTDALSIYLAYENVEQENEAPLHAWTDFNAPGNLADDGTGECNTATGWVEVSRLNGGVQCSPDNVRNLGSIDRETYDAPFAAIDGFQEVESEIARTEINYDFGEVLLTYRGGYRDAFVDSDVPLSPGFVFYRNEIQRAASQELRLSGGNDRFFWQGGLFFFNEQSDVASGLLAFIPGPPGPTGFWPNTFYRPDYESDSKSVFAQVDIPLSDSFTAVVGGRFTDDEKTVTNYNLPPGLEFDPARSLRPINTPGTTVTGLRSADEEFTWTAGLNWEPDEQTLVYGKVSTGYKAGGFDSTANEYGAETLLSVEFGAKLTLDRLSFAGSIFNYDYEDLQVSVLIDTNVGGQVFNAGEVGIWGLEGSIEYLVADSGRLTASLNYLDAEYDDFATVIPVQCLNCSGGELNAVGVINGEPPNLAGNTPPWAPEWILSFGYDHDWAVGDGATITGSIFSRYKSEYYATPYNYADGRQSAYTQTDASIAYTSANETWGVRAFIRNIEDEQPITYHSFTSAGPADIQNWFFGPPQTYGLQLSVNF